MRQKSTPAARNGAILCQLGIVLLIMVLSEKLNNCPRSFFFFFTQTASDLVNCWIMCELVTLSRDVSSKQTGGKSLHLAVISPTY